MQKKMQPLVLSTEQSGWVATSKLTKLSPAKMKAAGVATGAAALENLVAQEEAAAEDVINFLRSRFEIGELKLARELT
jgi:hypothetical protein